MFCNKCNINWSKLECEDDNGGYCPVCKSDMFLEDQKPGPVYFMDLDMNVVEVGTGKKLSLPTPPMPVNRNYVKPIYEQTREEFEAQQERMADAADAYLKSGNESDYFKTLSGCGTTNH